MPQSPSLQCHQGTKPLQSTAEVQAKKRWNVWWKDFGERFLVDGIAKDCMKSGVYGSKPSYTTHCLQFKFGESVVY